ncbi:pentatricopeptide repeat-containing protein [Dorcoceras hygrometricum]|uniref:Pentatricopeptide repeat-containing protein n=1 Tax=Dorcoceras hygrometricum TaxID=472368 RepID=A0A2Z7BTR6_9LAMI|nr:pentatricopeptide repeat-containing protein [Dorcoceras hygrometricum]
MSSSTSLFGLVGTTAFWISKEDSALLHLHTRIILLSSVLLAMPVLLIEEYQDAVVEDERVVPVYLRGRAGNSRVPLLPAGRGKSSRKHLKPTTGQPAASISLPPAGQPDASYSGSSRELQWIQSRASVLLHIQSTWYPDARKAEVAKRYIQTQATAHPDKIFIVPAVAMHPVASFAYPVDKETAVARSVVTKNEQQLSEQLLNNLLENIQPFDAINAQDGKNQWLK